MEFDVKEHLRILSEIHAVSGNEAPVRQYLQEAWAAWIDEFEVSGLGDLIGIKRATVHTDTPRRLMISAHMDEIGMMVSEIREGYLKVARVTGVDGRTLQAQSVIVHGKRPLTGIFAAIPPHISGGRGRTYPKLEHQWIDVGLPADEVADLVAIGDFVTYDAPMIDLKGGLVAGKAFDDRASLAAVSYMLHLLQRRLHSWDVYAVASVQEEIGHFGAKVAAHQINPDLGIALDVAFARQPGVSGDENIKPGRGIPVSIGPNFHPKWIKYVNKVASECDIPTTVDPISGASGTDAWDIQVAHTGVPTVLLNIPIRNMHSPIETASIKDIKRTGRLLAEVITALDDNTLESLAWDTPDNDDVQEAEA